MNDTPDTPDTPTPPKNSTLIPVTAFKAFHSNFIGVPRTGEMKITLVIPADDIHDALEVAQARDEILWIEVSKLRFTGVVKEQLAAKIAEQDREREKLGINATKPKKKARSTSTPPSELDWET